MKRKPDLKAFRLATVSGSANGVDRPGDHDGGNQGTVRTHEMNVGQHTRGTETCKDTERVGLAGVLLAGMCRAGVGDAQLLSVGVQDSQSHLCAAHTAQCTHVGVWLFAYAKVIQGHAGVPNVSQAPDPNPYMSVLRWLAVFQSCPPDHLFELSRHVYLPRGVSWSLGT